MDRRESSVLLRGGRAVCAVALLLWAAALLLVGLIDQEVTYEVCSGTLLQLPPPTIHWPPQGRHLELLAMQTDIALAAAATSMVGAFLVLYAQPAMGVFPRIRWLLATVAGSLIGVGLLWIVVQHHVLSAQINALAGCL